MARREISLRNGRYIHSICGMAVLLISWTSICGQSAAELATVTGRVLDYRGLPLEDARISIFAVDVGTGGTLPWVVTDDQGRYQLQSPPLGRVRLSAVKESAGYPDTRNLLFVSTNGSTPELLLTPGNRLELDIHLGPPDGIVEGNVIDSVTGSPVPAARIILRRRVPESMYSASVAQDGHFLFALPDAPIEMTVSAPGYAVWKFRGPEGSTKAMMVGPSDHRMLNVELTPAK